MLLNGRISVDRVAYPMLVGRAQRPADRERLTDNDYPSITTTRDGALWVAWQGFDNPADRVFAQRMPNGPVHTVSVKPGDVYRTGIAQDSEGKLWVIWSERVNDNWDLYARSFDGYAWSSLQRLTQESQPDIQHRVAADPRGRLHLVWQGWRNNSASIQHMIYDASEGWSKPMQLSRGGNAWEPALAIAPNGHVHVAWDQYGANGYDILMRVWASGMWHNPVTVASSARFEAYPTLAADKDNRVWIAWHESGVNWGKDWGYPYDITANATGLYNSRSLRVAVWNGAALEQPAQQPEQALPPPGNNFYEYPHLATDAEGRVHLFFRKRTPLQYNVYPRTPSHQALWEIYSTRYDGTRWNGMTLVPYSTGRHDMRIATTRDLEGNVVAAWPTDRRSFRDFINALPDVFAGRFPTSAPLTTMNLARYERTQENAAPVHAQEAADVERMRNYRYRVNNRAYRVFRGDMHRHTEISWDGYSDGATEDTYRYAIDAAAMDFLAITEHNFGVEDEYDWWRSQKFADIYRVGSSFVPLFAYERSATYPNGHRNIVFRYRGAPVLDVQHYEWGDNPNYRRQGAERLFGYLRKYNGIAMPHTTATDMGTDWRDYDPEVEPVVEIYQSDRNSYECVGCWRSAPPDEKKKQFGGYRPDGMVSEAWKRGYRLGVQASSDHLGVHTAYSMIIAAENTREALVEAIRSRRTYGATDNIVVDFRLIDGTREHLMGSDVRMQSAPRFRIHVEGTGPIQDLEIVKDNKMVFSQKPGTQTVDVEFADTAAPGAQASFYYVRIRQSDLQVAWGSPIWVSR